MSMTLTASVLIEAIAEHAAFRRIQRLQPVGGVGDKLSRRPIRRHLALDGTHRPDTCSKGGA